MLGKTSLLTANYSRTPQEKRIARSFDAAIILVTVAALAIAACAIFGV